MPTVVASASAATSSGVAEKMNRFDFSRLTKQKHNVHRHRRNISPARKLSFSAILCALGVVILFIGSMIEVVDISMAALASFLITVCMIEISGAMPFTVYLATSVLSFILLPTKTVSIIYVMFFGFYPILKNYIERLGFWLSWIAKFAAFNVISLVYYYIAKSFFFPAIEDLRLYVLIILNVVFFTFDLALTFFVTAYVTRFRKMLRISNYLK